MDEITIPTKSPDGKLTPGTLTFKQFIEFAEAVGELVEAALEVVRAASDREPYIGFKQIHNKDVNYVLRADSEIAPLFDTVIEALAVDDLQRLDPGLALGALEVHAVAKRHGWTWGIVHRANRVEVAPEKKLTLGRSMLRYPTTLRGTVIRAGGDTARVRFRLMNGRAYSSVVDRDFAKRLSLYTDYMFHGEADADADSMQIIKFKVRDAELVEEGELDTVLRELAATALPEFVGTDTTDYFNRA